MHLFSYVQNYVQNTVLFFSKVLGKVLILVCSLSHPCQVLKRSVQVHSLNWI